MSTNIKPIKFKNARFTFYSPVSLKIEYSKNGEFIDDELFVTDINDAREIKLFYLIRS